MKEFSTGGYRYKQGLIMVSPTYISTIHRINEKTGSRDYLCFFKKTTRKAIIAAFQENDKAIKHYHN